MSPVKNVGHCEENFFVCMYFNFEPLIESYGYNLIVKRYKYLKPHIQKYGLNPTMYYLFNNPNFIKK